MREELLTYETADLYDLLEDEELMIYAYQEEIERYMERVERAAGFLAVHIEKKKLYNEN